MRKEVKYYAFDDTDFDTEEECLQYERELKDSLANAAMFFDSDGDQIESHNYVAVEDAWYIYIKNEDLCLHLFNKLEDLCSFWRPDVVYTTGDILYWNDADNKWDNLTEQLKDLQKKFDKIKLAVEFPKV